jgi:hypothetical protein
MHKLPIRFHEDRWEVQVPTPNNHTEWIRCDTQGDAHRMSQSGKLAFEALECIEDDEKLAAELDEAAQQFLKYGCTERAAWLHEHAKRARGEPSSFDNARDD